jgi:hypothetical protein
MLNKIFKDPYLLLYSVIIMLLLSYMVLGSRFGELSLNVYFHLITFGLVFMFWYIVSKKIFEELKLKTVRPFLSSQVIYIVSILLFSYTSLKFYLAISTFELDSFMSFRTLTTSEEGLGERVSMGVGLSFPAVMASYYVAKLKQQGFIAVIFSFCGLLLAILSTSKVFLLIWLLYIAYLNKVNLKYFIVYFVIFVFLFAVSHIVLQKFSSNPEVSLIQALYDTFLVYLLGGLASYNLLVEGEAVIHPGTMFVSINWLFNPFISITVPDSAILPWVKIGSWNTNVYTAFGYWYAFLEGYYIVIIPTILGAYYAFFFNESKFSNQYFSFYRVFLIFCIIFVFFSDQFIPAYMMHVMSLFFSVLISITKK